MYDGVLESQQRGGERGVEANKHIIFLKNTIFFTTSHSSQTNYFYHSNFFLKNIGGVQNKIVTKGGMLRK